MTDLLLAGDIGGTKANLVLVPPGGDPRKPLGTAHLPSAGFASLEDLLRAALAQLGQPRVAWVSLGIPGPVSGGRVKPSNLPWAADEAVLCQALGLRGAVFHNDLVATALGIPRLADDERVILQAGEPVADAPIAVIAPGTGLGMATLIHDGRGYQALASEGGHADLAPRGRRQLALCAWLQERPGSGGTCNLEEAVSGRGLPNIWRFLGEVEGLRDSPAAEAAIAASADLAPQIMAAAADPANPRSQATARLFCLLLAQEAGNAALRTLTTGGVVLAGGVPPKILPWLREPAVVQAFRTNDRLGDLLARIPLLVATNDQAAVLGAVAGAGRRFGW